MLENPEGLVNENLNTALDGGYMDFEDENSVSNQLVIPPISEEYEERKKRNQEIFEILHKRDGVKEENSERNINEEDTFDMMDSDGYFRRPVALADVFRMPKYPEKICRHFSKTLTQEEPPVWMSQNMPGRHTFVSKYIRNTARAFREGLYSYDDPNYDPVFTEPDPTMNLEEAVMKEKELKARKRESERADRERMPPPAVPMNGDVKLEPSVREESTEKKFICSYDGCTKAYKNHQGLKNHIKNNHPGAPVPSRLSLTEESILASTLHNNSQKLPPPTSQPPRTPATQPRSQNQSRTPTPQQSYHVPTPPTTPQQPQLPPQQQQQQSMGYDRPLPQQQQQIQMQTQHQYGSQTQTQVQYVVTSMPMTVSSSASMYTQQIQLQQQPITIQQQPPQRMQVQNQQQFQQQPLDQTQYHQITVSSAQNPQSVEYMDESGQNYQGIRRQPVPTRTPTAIIKLKCPHCSKVYKTQPNLQKHIKELHPQATNEMEITLGKTSTGQAYYTTNQAQNRQEVMIMEQDGNSPRSNPVTYVRQIQQQPGQHVQIIEQSGQQTSQYGQQVVHYQVQQVSQQPQRQQQHQMMEVDPQQGYSTNESDVMVVDPSPPMTPKQGEHQQSQQMIIQTSSGQVMRQIPQSGQQGAQIIRQVHIIQQQPGQQMVTVPQGTQGERVTLVVRQGQHVKPLGPQQLRPGQQIVNAPGTAYVYQQTSGGNGGPVTAKYIVNAPSTQSRAPNSGEGESSEYYSSPPQLTPQQSVPQRSHRPQNSGSGFYRRAPPGQSAVRISQTPMGSSKPTPVRYTVQVPPGSQGQTYVSSGTPGPSGSVQYIRTSNGSIPQTGVRFITAGGQSVVRVPTQGIRQNQPIQSVQQYPMVQGQMTISTRPQNYQNRQPQRVKLTVPSQTNQPRRVRPATMIPQIPQSVNVVQVSQSVRQQNSGDNTGQIQDNQQGENSQQSQW